MYNSADLFRRLCDQEKYNIASRRSLCEQRDALLVRIADLEDALRTARDEGYAEGCEDGYWTGWEAAR